MGGCVPSRQSRPQYGANYGAGQYPPQQGYGAYPQQQQGGFAPQGYAQQGYAQQGGRNRMGVGTGTFQGVFHIATCCNLTRGKQES